MALPINIHDLITGQVVEFLKELRLTEGRCTGVPTILESMKKYFRTNILNFLIERKYLRMIYPNKPTHPQQQYVITTKARNLLKKYNLL